MEPSKPKKGPWFQYHLSTAIVLMFVAAGLLWANMHWSKADLNWGGYSQARGWPWHLQEWPINRDANEGSVVPILWNQTDEDPFKPHLRITGLVLNTIAAFAILGAIAFLCEWRIRRRERQHG